MSPTVGRSAAVYQRASDFRRAHLFSALALAFALLCTLAPAQAAASLRLSGNLGPANVGSQYSAALSVKRGRAPYQFSISAGQLPPGLALNPATGAISGVPSTQGTYSFTVRVTDLPFDGVGSNSFKLTVVGGSGGGGIGVTLSPQTATVSSGAAQSFVAAVSGTSNTAVTWSATAGTVSSSGVFTAPTVSSATSVTVSATSVADSTKKASATVSVVVQNASTPSISTVSVPSAAVGVVYASGVTANGGQLPYTWSVSSGSLPPGIQLDSTTGALNGTPTQQGQFSFAAKVTDVASHIATQNLTLSVSSQTTGGSFDGPAQLPRIYIQSRLANTPSSGTTILVNSGANLQVALNSANCGDTIALQAGAVFAGKFVLPAKPCDAQHWITIRTSAPNSSLPPEGTRITPCYAGVGSLPGRPSYNCSSPQHALAQIVNNQVNGAGPIQFAPGANHYRLVGLEITRAAGTGGLGALVAVQKGSTANNIIIDRSWVHGTAHDETTVGFGLSNVTYASIVDSYFTDFHCIAMVGTCTDAHAIAGGLGGNPGGPYQIVNNFLEASGENILFGGGPATVTPADIEIRRNHFFKPLAWKQGQPGFVGGPSGNPFIVKNHLELKNAQRVLIEANIFENNWGGFSQNGFSILLTPKNQYNYSSKASVCSACQVTDVTVRYATISHVGAGLQIVTALSDGGTAALAGARYSIHDITIDDINSQTYNGGGGLMQVANGWPTNVLNNVAVNHITAFPDPRAHLLTVGNQNSNPKMAAFSFTNSIVVVPGLPVWNTGGGQTSCAYQNVPLLTLAACFNGYGFNHNALIGTSGNYPTSSWPTGNFFPASTAAVQFVNYNNGNGGDYRLQASSPYKNAGSDGKDLGADINAIQSAISGVY
jgi:hypothetical protein